MKINFILLFINIFTISHSFNLRQQQPVPICYGISIDAGSSGTKVIVYEWECLNYSEIPKIKQNPTLKNKLPERLSDYAGKTNTLGNLFEKIFGITQKVIPQAQANKTIVLLGATAGMRLIPEKDQNEIMDECINQLSKNKYGYYFPNSQNPKSQKEWARVLSGEQEGAYLWMSVNYDLNKLTKSIEDDKNTVAVIDLGGASTQIAFSPNEKQEELKQNDFDLFIARYNYYHLYSKSYLKYGNDQARFQVLDYFKSQNYVSPCYFKGYKGTDGQNQDIQVEGTGIYTQCSEKILQYLKVNKDDCAFKSKDECSIGNQYQSQLNKDMQIYAVSSIQISANFLEFTNTFKLSDFLNKLKELYTLDWDGAQKKYPNEQAKYLQYNLFMTTYVYQLLKNGYNINDNTEINISLTDVGWDKSNLLQKLSTLNCQVTSQYCYKAPYQKQAI
ncbi:hypothetical protein IMG5_120890 [Ichthyophthirius multifiliis]|uniref:GDA1/CD39 nucleoside phosphatase family protein n=1 Tax=Ichthyophthirius multifiliis TaxID=5932 RepID=G0QV31_ICHMU|nr:hypothetical protein IMG5_120890 [Ichthyophthirius multifiliis]EGR30924.1 hypothetical protein IMG5_120890 [Ichthyophthirius multifiliis]|eukprot:XP_004032511.1 hypothetical protein IMG5_120890 [Ichthyophthirius multifiliis]